MGAIEAASEEGHDILARAAERLRRDPRLRALAALAAPRRLWLVGGCLRDAALGLEPKDLDCVVEGDAAPLAERSAAESGATLVRLGGERFAAFRLVDEAGWIDLWGLESETLESDLLRRDFTINAVACEAATGELVDPAGGASDLAHRRLRAPRTGVFLEDPVRVLRLVRFALVLPGFSADDETVEQARSAAPGVGTAPSERLRDELERILGTPELAAACAWFERLALRGLFPAGMRGPQSEEGGTAALSTVPEAELATIHWALLAATADGGREGAPAWLLEARRRGLATRSRIERATALLAPTWEVPRGRAARNRWLHGTGESWRLSIELRHRLAPTGAERTGWSDFAAELEELSDADRALVLQPARLLDGEDVQRILGIGPGREVGAALAALEGAQLDGAIATAEEAKRFLLRLGGGS